MTTTSTAVTAGAPNLKLDFVYDGFSRRVMKQVSRRNTAGTAWVLEKELRYIYEGWNLVAEVSTLKPGSSTARALQPLRSYLWGEDLSGTETGAGGVGGLLLVRQEAAAAGEGYVGWQVPCLDGNGNVQAYVDADSGQVLGRFEYDPFGRTVVSETVARYTKKGTAAAKRIAVELSPFRFSTKYEDAETGLLYYGYRYYAPEWGRWINRDPIEEEGGINLYGMVGNNGVDNIDYLGQFDWSLLKTMGSFTIPLNNWVPQLPSVSVIVNTYNHNGNEFDADLTLAFTWNAVGVISRYVPRGISVTAEVGFSGTSTVHVCGGRLTGGSSKLAMSVIVQGSLGSGSRTTGAPMQPNSRNPAYSGNYMTPGGVSLEGYTPPGSRPGNGVFATLRGQSDWVFDMEEWSLDWNGITVYVDGGYRYGWASGGISLGPYYLFQD